MKNKVRVKGELSIYLQWPLILPILLIMATMVLLRWTSRRAW